MCVAEVRGRCWRVLYKQPVELVEAGGGSGGG